MNIQEAAEFFNIENVPEEMAAFPGAEHARKEDLCSLDLIISLQERYDLFGSYFDLVKEAYLQVEKREPYKIWLDGASSYFARCGEAEAKKIPIPETDKTPAGDLLGLLILLPSVDDTYRIYRDRGFSHEETLHHLGNYKLNLWVTENFISGRPVISDKYYHWLCNYAKAVIFDHRGLNFQLRNHSASSYYIKNRATGEILPLSNKTTMHRDGIPVRSAGFEDETGSFYATFQENETAYVGYPVRNFRTENHAASFSKKDWEIVLAPGDDVLAVHIPRNTDLSPENVLLAYREAREIAARSYPERHPKAFVCSSWMMDPTLNRLLGGNSKISLFSAPYVRYPNRNDGKDVFHYVFPRGSDSIPYRDLPEDTSLQRKLKELYISGKYIYSYTGVILF